MFADDAVMFVDSMNGRIEDLFFRKERFFYLFFLFHLSYKRPRLNLTELDANDKTFLPFCGKQNTYAAETGEAWNICQISLYFLCYILSHPVC